MNYRPWPALLVHETPGFFKPRGAELDAFPSTLVGCAATRRELHERMHDAKSEGHSLPRERIDSLLRERAGRDVHAVAFAATHSPALFGRDGVLFVNPGSATLPTVRGPSGLGSVARLTLRDRAVRAEIVQL